MPLGLNSWPFNTVLRLVVCSVLFSYTKRSKEGDCVQTQLTNLSRIKEPRTDSPWKRQILKARSFSHLFPSSWVLRCAFWGKFFSNFLFLGNLTRAQEPRWRRVAWRTRTLYTAISRKIVGKSARDNPERYCGWSSRARLIPRFHPRSRPFLLPARARVHDPGKHMGCFAVYSSPQWCSFYPKGQNQPWEIAFMHVHVTQTNFTTKPRFEIKH